MDRTSPKSREGDLRGRGQVDVANRIGVVERPRTPCEHFRLDRLRECDAGNLAAGVSSLTGTASRALPWRCAKAIVSLRLSGASVAFAYDEKAVEPCMAALIEFAPVPRSFAATASQARTREALPAGCRRPADEPWTPRPVRWLLAAAIVLPARCS
jgi:hypothetical protein